MAAQINGHTVHHWSGIPARNEDGMRTGDAHKQSIQGQALRLITIDEVSLMSAELLGALETVVTKAVRKRGTYKVRQNGTTRAFGGVNVVMCADVGNCIPLLEHFWLQIPQWYRLVSHKRPSAYSGKKAKTLYVEHGTSLS